MQDLAGPQSEVHFTHLSQRSCETLQTLFSPTPTSLSSVPVDDAPPTKGKAKGYAHPEGVLELMKSRGVSIEKVCLLDPKATEELSPEDGDGRFEWFLFGVRYLSSGNLCCFRKLMVSRFDIGYLRFVKIQIHLNTEVIYSSTRL